MLQACLTVLNVGDSGLQTRAEAVLREGRVRAPPDSNVDLRPGGPLARLSYTYIHGAR